MCVCRENKCAVVNPESKTNQTKIEREKTHRARGVHSAVCVQRERERECAPRWQQCVLQKSLKCGAAGVVQCTDGRRMECAP